MGVFFLVFLTHCNHPSPEKITIAAGSLAGAWSAISEGLIACIRRGLPGVAVTSEPGLDGANAVLVDSGRVQLGLIHAGMVRLALRGEYPYRQKLESIRGLSLIYADSALHFLVNRETGLTSIEQIREQRYPLRLSVIYRGSLMEIASQAVLEAYGITYRDLEAWGGRVYFRALRPSLELMKDGRLDAVSVTVQYPQSLISEAGLKQEFRLLPLSTEAVAYVNNRLGTYASTIPAGSYRFLQEDLFTLSDVVLLIANAGLDADQAYQISRAIHENLDYLHKVHRALSKLTANQLPPVDYLPLHPGALRFYHRAGILKENVP